MALPGKVNCRIYGALFVLCALMLLSAGCGLIQGVADVPSQAVSAVTPGAKPKPGPDPVEIQQELQRFADGFFARLNVGIERLGEGTNLVSRADTLRWRIALGTETCSIVSGPNSLANLLDMTVFVSVARMSIEDYWVPTRFGEAGIPLLEACRESESNVWQLVSSVCSTQHQAEMHKAIQEWHEKKMLPGNILAARATGIASLLVQLRDKQEGKSGSVFGLLTLDPFAGLDPATREVAQLRLFAERALYVTQRMPQLIRWQTELLALDATQNPAIQQVVSNSTLISVAIDRVAQTAEQLPDLVSAEREEIVKALAAQEKDLNSLLTNGTQMSDSLNITLKTFDALMVRFGVGVTNDTPAAASEVDTNSQPFRIQDYTATAAQLEKTARQLTEMLATLNATLSSTNLDSLTAHVSPVVDRATTGGRELANYIFWRVVVLIGIVLVAALGYRFLADRFGRKSGD